MSEFTGGVSSWIPRQGLLIVAEPSTVYILPRDAESPVVLDGLAAEIWREATDWGPQRAVENLALRYAVPVVEVAADVESIRADLCHLQVLHDEGDADAHG